MKPKFYIRSDYTVREILTELAKGVAIFFLLWLAYLILPIK